MKFYDLSRRERRKLKNQFDKTKLGTTLKDSICIYLVISVLFLVSPVILCLFKGFNAISITGMLTFIGFFICFIGIFCIMVMFRYHFLRLFYEDRENEKKINTFG